MPRERRPGFSQQPSLVLPIGPDSKGPLPSRRRPQLSFEIASAAELEDSISRSQLLLRRPGAALALAPKAAVLFSAGAIAGAIGKTITAPIDRVKLLLQVKGGLAGGTLQHAAARGGLVESFVTIGRQEGIMGYWKGNLPQVMRVLPYSALQLCSYDLYKKMLAGGGEERALPMAKKLLAGALAGMTSTFLTYPLDTLRLKLAADASVQTIGGASAVLMRSGGVPAFFRGVGPALLGIAPYMALELGAFDALPQQYPAYMRGFTAALIATSICYPLDTIRRQIQLHQHATMAGMVQSVITTEGLGGLYRGWLPNAMKNLPNKSIRLGVYDAAKVLMANSERELEEEAALMRAEKLLINRSR